MATEQTSVSQADSRAEGRAFPGHAARLLLAGTVQAVAVFAGLLLAVMLLDWLFTPFETTARIAMTFGVLLAGIAAWFVFGLLPATSRKSAAQATTSVSADGDVDGEHRLSRPQLRSAFRNLVAVLALFVIAFLVDRAQLSVLWQRFWSHTQEISLTTVTSPTADRTVERDHSVSIVGQLQNRFRDRATIWLEDHEGNLTKHAMTPVAGKRGTFEFQLDRVSNPMQFRIRAGDGQTPWHQLNVVDRPRLTNVLFRITPPAYSGLPVETHDGLPESVRALAGSALELNICCNEPLRHFNLRFAGGAETSLAAEEECVAAYRRELTEDLSFSPHLVNMFDLSNEQPPTCNITVYHDEPPSVSIESLEADAGGVTVEFTARDDFGIAGGELLINAVDGTPAKSVDIPLGKPVDQTEIQVRHSWTLKDLELPSVARLDCMVRVRDANDGAGESSPQGLTLTAGD